MKNVVINNDSNGDMLNVVVAIIILIIVDNDGNHNSYEGGWTLIQFFFISRAVCISLLYTLCLTEFSQQLCEEVLSFVPFYIWETEDWEGLSMVLGVTELQSGEGWIKILHLLFEILCYVVFLGGSVLWAVGFWFCWAGWYSGSYDLCFSTSAHNASQMVQRQELKALSSTGLQPNDGGACKAICRTVLWGMVTEPRTGSSKWVQRFGRCLELEWQEWREGILRRATSLSQSMEIWNNSMGLEVWD